MNQFDQYRLMGKLCLEASDEWMVRPSTTTKKFVDWISHTVFRTDADSLEQPVYQSLFADALICGRWAMSGFPTVVYGHKTAAALCSTKMRPEDAVEFVRPPWPAFVIRLPDNLLAIDDRGVVRYAELLAVTALDPGSHEREPNVTETVDQPKDQHRWWFKLIARSKDPVRPSTFPTRPGFREFFQGISLWAFNQATQYLAMPDGGENELGYVRWETQTTEDSDKRTERLARALILSTCMYLSGDPRELAERTKESGITVRERKSKQRDGDEFPQYTSFEVGSSIHVNMTQPLRDFQRDGGSVPSVQTYVQGHWKRVAIGVGRTQRKIIHVHPYWRGDLNAPISTRIR